MIKAEHLFKKYGARTVVSDVSFEIKAGEALGFIGPNGAGKSTTIKMLSGVLPVYAGKVIIGGHDVMQEPRQAKKLIGYLPENAPLPPDMTVTAFLNYAASMHGLGGRARKNAVENALERCALQSVANEDIEALSKGYKRRVCLAQAILHDPPVLMMDEPTDGLDPNQKREIRNLIQLLRRDTAIIISTHILEEIRSVCSRVLLLAQGKIVFDGSTDAFTKLENTLSGIAFRIQEQDLIRAAALLRKHHPGLCRIDDLKLVVPADDAISGAIRKTLTENGIEILSETSAPAALDDVFASLTALPAEPEGLANDAKSAVPEKSQEADDDD